MYIHRLSAHLVYFNITIKGTPNIAFHEIFALLGQNLIGLRVRLGWTPEMHLDPLGSQGSCTGWETIEALFHYVVFSLNVWGVLFFFR